MSSFLLKIVACITMFIDHIGYLVNYGKMSFYNYIGRIAFPIFAFQISEGYTHTKSIKKYIFRLFIFAIVSQYPYMLFHNLISSGFSLNIFFTLLLGLFCIIIYDKYITPLKNVNDTHTLIQNFIVNLLTIIVCVCIAFISEIAHLDYGFYGVAIILLFYIFKNNTILMNLAFLLCTLIKYLIYILNYGYTYKYVILFLCTLSSLIFINLYNKKQGKKIKYFLYFFYPVHLLLIFITWNIIYV